jgi:hypothetical protein
MQRRTVLALGALVTGGALVGSAAPSAVADSSPHRTGMPVWLSHADTQLLKRRLARGVEPQATAYRVLVAGLVGKDLERAADRTPVQPRFYVGPFYETPPELLELSYRFRGDAHAAYRLALGHAITGDPELAVAARSLILRWRAIEEFDPRDDTPLVWANQFPEFCWAAEILRRTSPVWKHRDEEAFADLVRRGLDLDPSHRTNNWGSWGVVLRMTSAAYLDDRPGFAAAATRWRELFDSQFDENGWQPEEIRRRDDNGDRGICYSHFNMHPLTLAAQMASRNGIDLFGHRNAHGVGLGDAFHVLMRWTVDPDEFSRDTGYWPDTHDCHRANGAAPSFNYGYGEILHRRFPDADFVRLATEDRPLSFNWTGSLLTVTHGEPLTVTHGEPLGAPPAS